MGWALRPKQPLEDGTNLYQKPTPKQDKGGGIIPTAVGACSVLQSSNKGGANARPAACFGLPFARSQHAGNPRFEYLYEFIRLLKK